MTTQSETGGPAFPVDNVIARDECGRLVGTEISSGGISIRDYFAAKAMQGLVASCTNDQELTLSLSAKWCYEMADAMLEARK